jgi:hypothetical protein
VVRKTGNNPFLPFLHLSENPKKREEASAELKISSAFSPKFLNAKEPEAPIRVSGSFRC